MPYYAQIAAGRVVAVTETSGVIDAAHMVALESLNTGLVGHSYDGSTFLPPQAAPVARLITRLAFSRRFTADEEADIEIAGLDVPAGNPAARKAQAEIRVATRRMSLAQHIDLDDAELRATVQAYEAAGLLGAGRALEILDAPVIDAERP